MGETALQWEVKVQDFVNSIKNFSGTEVEKLKNVDKFLDNKVLNDTNHWMVYKKSGLEKRVQNRNKEAFISSMRYGREKADEND